MTQKDESSNHYRATNTLRAFRRAGLLGVCATVPVVIYKVTATWGLSFFLLLLYLSIGLPFMAGALISAVRRRTGDSAYSDWDRQMLFALSDGVLTRLRYRSVDFVDAIVFGTAWPAMIAAGAVARVHSRHMKGADTPNTLVAQGYSGAQATSLYASVTLVLTAGCYLLALRSGAVDWPLAVLAAILLSSIIARQIRYLLTPRGLIWMLKALPTRPRLRYFMIAVSDFSSLVLSVVVLGDWMTGAEPASSAVYVTASKLALLRELWSSLEGPDVLANLRRLTGLSHIDLIILAVGIVFYISLGRHLLAWREFERDDEDHERVAIALTLGGRFREALLQLAHVRRLDTSHVRIAPHIAEGEVAQAEEEARRFLKGQARLKAPSLDDVYTCLFEAAGAVWMPASAIVNLFASAREKGVVDALCACASLDIQHRTHVTTQELRAVFAPYRSSYPLTCVTVMPRAGAEHAVAATLAGITPYNRGEQLAYLVVQLIARLQLGPAYSGDDLDRDVRTVKELAGGHLSYWEQLIALGALHYYVAAAPLDHPVRPELLLLIRQFEEHMATTHVGLARITLMRAQRVKRTPAISCTY